VIAGAPPPERPAAAAEPAVQVSNLTKDYGETLAVDGISFEVGAGEIFGLIGPNGAGKTTTLRILATLIEPTAGEVRIGGLSVEDEPEKVRAIMGYMPDQFGVYDGNTVEEYLEFFAGAFKVPSRIRAAAVADVMALTDLTGLKGRMVSELSRGMKQRLCLAKTLIHDPKVLILDEPASALDPRARIELRALLKELGRMGKTIIISSHILTELSDLCTAVGIIERGRLLDSGSVELLQRKRWGARRVKVRLYQPCAALKPLLAGRPEVGEVRNDGCEVAFDYLGSPQDFHKLVKLLADHEVPLLSIVQDASDLEGLFMELTKGDVQ
jgi:ABC-2 type transport system ATP-binding protein